MIIFVWQGLSFSKLSTSFLSSLHHYSDYVGVNILLNNSSSFSFFMFMLPLFALLQRVAEPTHFSLHFFLLQKLLNSGGFSLPSPPLELKRHFCVDPVGKNCSILSFPLTSFLSMTLTPRLFSIVPLVVAPPLKFPYIPHQFSFLASGRCFRTWALITY